MSGENGVAVWRGKQWTTMGIPFTDWWGEGTTSTAAEQEPGRWYPADEAAALEAVIAAALARRAKPGTMRTRDWLDMERKLGEALDRLDATRQAA